MNKLSKRLEVVASFVNDNSKVIDIGCDHGLLSIYLVNKYKNVKVIASDINENALSSAITNIKKEKLENRIETRLGSGLDVVKADEIDTIVIAGMGANTIVGILKYSTSKLSDVNNIIIQRFGIDEVKRIMTTSGIAYVVVGIIVSLLSLTINSDYVLTSNEIFNSLFGYDINNIRIFIGGFVSIMLMLWSSSYVYYYIRRSKNILWFSNIGTMLFIQMLESIIFVIISYIGEFDFTLLFGMIVIRYLIKIMIGMIGLIPVYTIVKMKDK